MVGVWIDGPPPPCATNPITPTPHLSKNTPGGGGQGHRQAKHPPAPIPPSIHPIPPTAAATNNSHVRTHTSPRWQSRPRPRTHRPPWWRPAAGAMRPFVPPFILPGCCCCCCPRSVGWRLIPCVYVAPAARLPVCGMMGWEGMGGDGDEGPCQSKSKRTQSNPGAASRRHRFLTIGSIGSIDQCE